MTPQQAQNTLQRFKNGMAYNTQNRDGDTFIYKFDTSKNKMTCVSEGAFDGQKTYYEYTDEEFLVFLEMWQEIV